MERKNIPLEGAYYGPAIPPQRQHHRPGRSRNCCSIVLKIIAVLVVIIAALALATWLVIRPRKVKFYVTDATLSEFNFTDANNLRYNMSVAMSVRNPNKRVGIYFDRLEVKGLYEDNRFGSVFQDPFYLGHKDDAVIRTSLQGQHVMMLSNDDKTKFDKDKEAGSFDIELKLYLKIRMKIGSIKVGKIKPKVSCDLTLPLGGTGTTIGIGKRCKLHYR